MRTVLLAVACATSAATAAAQELTLDQMILAAPSIVVATVESRRAEEEFYGSSRLIVTKITLNVEQTIKGSTSRTLVVDVLGGTLGDTTLHVSHVPEFRVGDRDVLFLSNAPHDVSPLVGSDQGRFRVLTDNETRQPRVLMSNFEPLNALNQVGSARSGFARRMTEAMTLGDFVDAVRDRIRALGAR